MGSISVFEWPTSSEVAEQLFREGVEVSLPFQCVTCQ